MSFVAACIRSLRLTNSSSVSTATRLPQRTIVRRALPTQAIREHRRFFADGKSAADIAIEDITELYATAQDEFEIAMEETEKVSVYAEEDRKAARTELENVQAAYKKIVEGEDKDLAAQVERRVGHRIRELEQGVKRMEEMALEHD